MRLNRFLWNPRRGTKAYSPSGHSKAYRIRQIAGKLWWITRQSIIMLLLLAGSAAADVTWETNDHPETGDKRAVVLVTNSDGAVLAVRIDRPTHAWLIYGPTRPVYGRFAQVQFQCDGGEVIRLRAASIGQPLWQPIGPSALQRALIAEYFVLCESVKVQLTTGVVDTFSLVGYRQALLEAFNYVASVEG